MEVASILAGIRISVLSSPAGSSNDASDKPDSWLNTPPIQMLASKDEDVLQSSLLNEAISTLKQVAGRVLGIAGVVEELSIFAVDQVFEMCTLFATGCQRICLRTPQESKQLRR